MPIIPRSKKKHSLKFLFLASVVCTTVSTRAQRYQQNNVGFAHLSISSNKTLATASLSYERFTRFDAGNDPGKLVIFECGLGVRLTRFGGKNMFFPSVPQIIHDRWKAIKDPDPTHQDSIFIATPQLTSFNLTGHFGVVKKRWRIGASVDLIGYTAGGSRNATYINASSTQPVTARPESFNLLLNGAADQRGSLNGEIYIVYVSSSRWTAKLGMQFTTIEYVTDTKVQQYPVANDRFRNESYLVSYGIGYQIH